MEKLVYGAIKWLVIIPCMIGIGIIFAPFIFIVWCVGGIINQSIRPYKNHWLKNKREVKKYENFNKREKTDDRKKKWIG